MARVCACRDIENYQHLARIYSIDHLIGTLGLYSFGLHAYFLKQIRELEEINPLVWAVARRESDIIDFLVGIPKTAPLSRVEGGDNSTICLGFIVSDKLHMPRISKWLAAVKHFFDVLKVVGKHAVIVHNLWVQ